MIELMVAKSGDHDTSTVLAVVGLAGAGKSSVAETLATMFACDTVYFGGVIIDEVRRRGLPVTPATERTVREDLRRQAGVDAVARQSLSRIQRSLEANTHVVVDGVYTNA